MNLSVRDNGQIPAPVRHRIPDLSPDPQPRKSLNVHRAISDYPVLCKVQNSVARLEVSVCAGPNMPYQIVAIGAYEALVKARTWVLRAQDYHATWGLEEDALKLLRRNHYDLLLVCSSVSVQIASELIRHAKNQAPKMCVVRLVNPGVSPSIDAELADEVVIFDYDPSTWINAVDRLLGLSE